MSDQSRQTGTQDEHYNLVSVLYHALQGGEVYDQYIADAESHDDQELAQYFRDVQEEERQRAERAKKLLGTRLGGG
jgi:rubrerythrin